MRKLKLQKLRSKAVKYVCFKTSQHFTAGDIVFVEVVDNSNWYRITKDGKTIKCASIGLGITKVEMQSEIFQELNIMPLKESRRLKLKQLGI